MKMYMVRRNNYVVRPENMMAMMLKYIPGTGNAYEIEYFKTWHRKRDAQAYIDSIQGDTRGLYSVITLQSTEKLKCLCMFDAQGTCPEHGLRTD